MVGGLGGECQWPRGGVVGKLLPAELPGVKQDRPLGAGDAFDVSVDDPTSVGQEHPI